MTRCRAPSPGGGPASVVASGRNMLSRCTLVVLSAVARSSEIDVAKPLAAESCDVRIASLAPFGAEVALPTNASTLPPCGVESLRAALTEHRVLILRDLDLSMRDHVSLARKLGTVDEEMSRPPPYVESGVHVSDGSAARKTSGFLARTPACVEIKDIVSRRRHFPTGGSSGRRKKPSSGRARINERRASRSRSSKS